MRPDGQELKVELLRGNTSLWFSESILHSYYSFRSTYLNVLFIPLQWKKLLRCQLDVVSPCHKCNFIYTVQIKFNLGEHISSGPDAL